jgi:RNA polymerase sigma-70 factor (ECF subfamily)
MNNQNDATRKPTSFVALSQRLRTDLLRYAFWLCSDQAVAEDVVQEALREAMSRHDVLLDEASAKSGLLTIVRLRYARRVKRKRLVMMGFSERGLHEHPLLAAGEDPDLAKLRAALFKLPQKYREPLVLQVLMGLSIAEIAAELQLSHSAVRSRLFRGRKRLRTSCGEDTDRDADG